jgi:hypothetical protein
LQERRIEGAGARENSAHREKSDNHCEGIEVEGELAQVNRVIRRSGQHLQRLAALRSGCDEARLRVGRIEADQKGGRIALIQGSHQRSSIAEELRLEKRVGRPERPHHWPELLTDPDLSTGLQPVEAPQLPNPHDDALRPRRGERSAQPFHRVQHLERP